MRLVEITLPLSAADMPDADLARFVRARLHGAALEQDARLEAGRASVRRQLGTPITIDGVTYDSRSQAMKALGMNFAQFAKKYPNTP